jgi:hypothetical protein
MSRSSSLFNEYYIFIVFSIFHVLPKTLPSATNSFPRQLISHYSILFFLRCNCFCPNNATSLTTSSLSLSNPRRCMWERSWSSARSRRAVSFRIRPFYTPRKLLRLLLNKRLGGPQSRSGRFGVIEVAQKRSTKNLSHEENCRFLMYLWTLNSNIVPQFLYHPHLSRCLRLCESARHICESLGACSR